MVECAFPYPDERAEFDAFYAGHISMLLTIDGFLSARRFECLHEARAPFLAVYALRDDEVLSRPTYTNRAGPTSVAPHIREKMHNWDRNLLHGPLAPVEVEQCSWMVLIDRLGASAPALPGGAIALRPVGLDESVIERGVMVGIDGTEPAPIVADANMIVRQFRPLHAARFPD